MLFKKRKLALVLGIAICMLFSSVPVYASGVGSAGSNREHTSHGSGSPWSGPNWKSGTVYVWWDRGPQNPEADNAAERVKPEQGYYSRADQKMHKGSTDKTTYEFFTDKLTAQLKANTGHSYTFWDDGPGTLTSYPKTFKKDMEKACKRAISDAVARGLDPKTSRVVGVGTTYRAGKAYGKSNIWGIQRALYSKSHTLTFEKVIKKEGSKTDLQDTVDGINAWALTPDKNVFTDAKGNDDWRQYVWKRANAAQASNTASGTNIAVWYIVAVTDAEPRGLPTEVQFVKTLKLPEMTDGNAQYSNANAKFTIYDKDNKVIASAVTGADGRTPIIEIAEQGTYTVVEEVTPKGAASYKLTHTMKIGDDYVEPVITDDSSEYVDETEHIADAENSEDGVIAMDNKTIDINTEAANYQTNYGSETGKFWAVWVTKGSDGQYDVSTAQCIEIQTGETTVSDAPAGAFLAVYYTADGSTPNYANDDPIVGVIVE